MEESESSTTVVKGCVVCGLRVSWLVLEGEMRLSLVAARVPSVVVVECFVMFGCNVVALMLLGFARCS